MHKLYAKNLFSLHIPHIVYIIFKWYIINCNYNINMTGDKNEALILNINIFTHCYRHY